MATASAAGSRRRVRRRASRTKVRPSPSRRHLDDTPNAAVAPTVEELRQARDAYYSRSPDQRRGLRAPMAHISESAGSSTVRPTDPDRPRRSSDKRRRRKPKDERDDDAGGLRVYASSTTLRPRTADQERDGVRRSKSARTDHKRRKSSGNVSGARSVAADRIEKVTLTRGDGVTARRGETKRRSGREDGSTLRRSVSMRESTSTTIRPPLQRSNTTTRTTTTRTRKSPTGTSLPGGSELATDTTKDRRRSSGLLGAIFGMSAAPAAPARPERKVECLTCLADDVPVSRSAKLGCGHVMCHDCLKRIFTLSVKDPQHMPPKCCTADHIPLKHVDRLFDLKFKMKWNRKYHEYTTENRIYCPRRGCGEWIKPAHIHSEAGRRYGKCKRCSTKVCCKCNGRWHSGRECPKDDETRRFVEIAKKEGWQRCHNCQAMVELKEGCNHMTCRCTAEFCMICGAKWKTCNCPWFSYEQVAADRLNHMQIPQVRMVRQPDHGGYAGEMDRRRRQEERDEDFARRMQVLDLNGDDAVGARYGPGGMFPPQPANADYMRVAADFLGGAYDQAAAAANQAMGIGLGRAGPAGGGGGGGGGRVAERARRHYAVPSPDEAADPFPRTAVAPPPLRQHSTASRRYNVAPTTRASERVVPRRTADNDYAAEAERHAPLERSRSRRTATGTNDARRHSMMAGLTRHRGSQGGRVGAWLEYVEDGAPAVDEGGDGGGSGRGEFGDVG
ncbi:MAG: hypothetical protein M1832_004171 [Thelocarpon impressellum]|nr:MAG: hypothetical protein M1832_004171 [Thelocarpon impressellum]